MIMLIFATIFRMILVNELNSNKIFPIFHVNVKLKLYSNTYYYMEYNTINCTKLKMNSEVFLFAT